MEKNIETTTLFRAQGDLVGRLTTPITHLVTLLISLINLVTKSA